MSKMLTRPESWLCGFYVRPCDEPTAAITQLRLTCMMERLPHTKTQKRAYQQITGVIHMYAKALPRIRGIAPPGCSYRLLT
jgi:hypothetical protein